MKTQMIRMFRQSKRKLRGKAIALQAYIMIEQGGYIRNLMTQFKKFKNDKQNQLKTQAEENFKIRAKINELEILQIQTDK